METILSYTIKEISVSECRKMIDFAMNIRKDIFPMLNHEQIPLDFLQFNEHYGQPENAVFLAAFSEEETILGTIGLIPYDGRFSQLDFYYGAFQTAEVVKCYTDPGCRRLGIGSALVREAVRFGRKAGYEMLYLHTHPFLPGAVSFWEAQGFTCRMQENEPVWKTIHMDRVL